MCLRFVVMRLSILHSPFLGPAQNASVSSGKRKEGKGVKSCGDAAEL